MPLPGCMMPDGGDPCEAYSSMRNLVEQMVEAIDAGSIDSPEQGEPEVGIPIHKWHEEWRYYAGVALQKD